MTGTGEGEREREKRLIKGSHGFGYGPEFIMGEGRERRRITYLSFQSNGGSDGQLAPSIHLLQFSALCLS